MASVPKQERLLNLVSLLLKARQPVPWGEIRSGLLGYDDPEESEAAAVRRFERDKASLREMGIPVEYRQAEAPDGAGYVIPRSQAFLPRMDLSPEEAAVLAVVGHFGQEVGWR